jgi:uncharacterized protein (DUF433 family)
MRVLVDTSVWSLALRKKGPSAHSTVEKLTSLLQEDEDVVLTGMILQEILQAFRSVLGMLAAGDRPETILEGYPWLEAEDIQACLVYARRLVGHERVDPALGGSAA